ncbi:MAG: hypothetical protein WAS21_01915 [Geminicoccaceae bacterium]
MPEKALEAEVPLEPGFEALLLGKEDANAAVREEREKQRVADDLGAVIEVMGLGQRSGWR